MFYYESVTGYSEFPIQRRNLMTPGTRYNEFPLNISSSIGND